MSAISKAFRDQMITILKRADRRGILEVKLGEIPTSITIKIVRTKTGGYKLDLSHGIYTNGQSRSYEGSSTVYRTRAEALSALIFVFAGLYLSAVKRGFQPNKNWLVPVG